MPANGSRAETLFEFFLPFTPMIALLLTAASCSPYFLLPYTD